ncbi:MULTISPECIES: hypothetical protein [Achromobacter]|uniref:Uncharacterized protein n=1 Tax=Achromobacter xylosoxidans (strain A8) TaxID=762376 RepID=E3HYI0_ACHXA|nr:hypothetical protein [Achromobacter xylosoxidans]ADP20134.1 hypothetical protein AXYL_06852 [Achromobacter xylosoxidans A8]
MSDTTLIENAPGGASILTIRSRYVLEVGEPAVLEGHVHFSAPADSKAAGRHLPRVAVPFWLLVEEVETFKAASSGILLSDSIRAQAYKAEFKIKYWILSDGASELCPDQGGWFEARYSRAPGVFGDDGRLTMHRPGLLIVDPESIRRFRLGSYIQDEITRWAKYWPRASVDCVSLHAAQAETDEDRITRNKFWGRYGFRFVWKDPVTMREGVSAPMKAEDLRIPLSAPDRYRHIQPMEVAQHLALTHEKAEGACKAHAKVLCLSNYLYELEQGAKKQSLRWAVSGKWRQRTADLLERSDEWAEDAVQGSPSIAAGASDSALLASAPVAHTLQVFHELSRLRTLEASKASNAELGARRKWLDVQHLLDYPVSWRSRSAKAR